jgi:hypothetical protein
MSVFFFTSNKKTGLGKGDAPAVAFERRDMDELKAHAAGAGDMTYVDVTGLADADRRKLIAAAKRRCGESAWGVVDPKGSVGDPASVFFAGASDYVGPFAFSAGVDKARVKAALAFARRCAKADEMAQAAGPASPDQDLLDDFPGWKSVKPGTSYPFFFLYFSASGQVNFKTRLGEAGYATFRERIRSQIQQSLAEADPLLWMENDSSGLFLVPPKAANARSAVIGCLRNLLGAPLIGYEKLGLPVHLNFTFAMHYGRCEFAAPGKTGTIVSDAINFIFHLGQKRAEAGRLTLSKEAARLAVPAKLSDMFSDAGAYEGRDLSRSRLFGSP